MKKLLFASFLLLVIACDRSLVGPEPLGPVFIKFIERAKDDSHAIFTFSNTGESPVYFMGYAPQIPIYFAQAKGDTGWVDRGPCWCGTGLQLQTLTPQSSFTFKAFLNGDDQVWRVGIWLYTKDGEYDAILWSPGVKL